MKKVLTVLLIVALWAGAANAADSVLGVNFSGAWSGPHVGMGAHPTQTADGFSNWTDSDPISSGDGRVNGTGLVVLGSDSGVTVDWASAGAWYAGLEDNAENALYRYYLDDGGSGPLITIHGLSNWLASVGATGYTVRLYQNTDWNLVGVGFLTTNLTDGTNILASVTPTNMWAAANGGTRAFVDSGALTAGTLVIDGANGPTDGKRGCISAFKITAIPKVQAVAPANGAVNVAVDQDLSWTVNGAAVTNVDLYLASDPNVGLPAYKKLSMEPAATTTWDTALLSAGRLEYSTTYYWRIDAYEPNGLSYTKTQGGVWSFTTVGQSAIPGAVTPAYTAVDAGTAAVVLNLTGTVNATIYHWYKDGGALSDGADFSGTATASLTINDVQLADEGSYYCQVDNDLAGTDPVNSAAGIVLVKRLMSHYPMEVIDANSTPDIVGGFNMTLKNDVLGQSLPVLGTDVAAAGNGTYSLVLDNPSTDPNGQRFGQIAADVVKYEDLTIGVWVKWNGGNDWQRIVDFGANNTNYMFLTPNAGGAGLRFVIMIGSGEQQLNASKLTVGEWTYVAVTLNGDTGRMYVNGELVNTNAAIAYDPYDLPQTLNYVGKSQFAGDSRFDGLIDELKIYDYARSSAQIGQDYADISGDWVCNMEGTADLALDFNDDCRVDLGDFALLAAEWLNSNRIYQQP
jgi:hypothetical protein